MAAMFKSDEQKKGLGSDLASRPKSPLRPPLKKQRGLGEHIPKAPGRRPMRDEGPPVMLEIFAGPRAPLSFVCL